MCPSSDVEVRLTIRLLGTEVFHISTDREDDDEDKARDLSGGTTATTPVGFVADYERVAEIGVDL